MQERYGRVWGPEGAEGGGAGDGASAAAAAPAAAGSEGQPAAAAPASTEGLLSQAPAAQEGSPTDPPNPEGAPKPPEEGNKEPEPAALKPEDYRLELPDSISKDDDLLQDFLAGAAKGGLDNESVNAILQSLGPKMAERQQAPFKAWQKMNLDWQTEVKADPEFGGTNLAPTVQRIASTIDRFSKPEEAAAIRQALDHTGAGNHPAIVRFLARVSRALTEGGAVAGSPSADPAANLKRMYPSAQ